jgi:hypothetical protein
MIEYLLGCATVGVAWYVWPRISAWLSGEETKVETQAKADLSAVAKTATADLSVEAHRAKTEIGKLEGRL